MNSVVAVRELSIEGDSSKKVRVEICQPQLSPDGIYRCEFRIEGAPEGMTNINVGGVDSYQALCLAIRSIANVVDDYNKKYCHSKLQWMGETDLELHFSTKLE
ncbi:hypothetical protein D3C87_1388260 [compost metagenome]